MEISNEACLGVPYYKIMSPVCVLYEKYEPRVDGRLENIKPAIQVFLEPQTDLSINLGGSIYMLQGISVIT